MNKLFLFLTIILIAGAGCSSSNDGTAGAGGTAGIGGMGGAGGSGGQGGTGGAPPDCSTPEALLRCDGVVLNIAHRGGRRIRPEHTLVAYEQALADGADVLELDIHATSDGVIVVMHDDMIDRTTNGEGFIKDMTFAELRIYDAGYNFTTDDGATYPYRDMGLVVPSLEEVLEAFPDVPYVIEIKQAEPSIVDAFVAMTREHGVVDQINGASFNDDVLAELRAAAPEMATSFSEDEVVEYFLQSGNPDGIDPSYVPPAEFLQVPPRQGELEVLHERFIPTAHELGLKVHVWTINDEEEMRTLIEDFGVDGIMTDDPPLLTTVIEETGTGLPD
jgi:glycerophosphoryl diester phosphodiesterase